MGIKERGCWLALIHVAFGVGLWAHVLWGLFCGVGDTVVQVGQGHSVLLVDIALKLHLQARPLIVGEGQGDESLGLTNKLVNVALSCHLWRDGRVESDRNAYKMLNSFFFPWCLYSSSSLIAV